MVFYGVTVERSFCYYIKQLRECKIRLFSIQMSKQPKKIMGKSENLHQTCRRWMSSHFVPRPEIANHWRCNPNGAPCLKRREAGRVSEFPIWISIYRGPSTCLTWKHIEIRDVKTRKYLCMNGKMPSPLLAAKKSVKSCQRGVSTTGARRPPPTGSAKNPLRGSLMRPCRLPIHLPFRVTPYVIPRKILDTPMSHTHMQSVCKYRLYIYIYRFRLWFHGITWIFFPMGKYRNPSISDRDFPSTVLLRDRKLLVPNLVANCHPPVFPKLLVMDPAIFWLDFSTSRKRWKMGRVPRNFPEFVPGFLEPSYEFAPMHRTFAQKATPCCNQVAVMMPGLLAKSIGTCPVEKKISESTSPVFSCEDCD